MAAKLELTPAQQKQVLFGLLGVIGLAGWFNFLILPQQRKLAEIRPQVQNLKGQIAQVRQGLAQLPTMESQMSQLSIEFKLPEVVPAAEQQLPELLESITQVARQSQVRLVAAKPKSDISKLSPGSSGYLELPIFIIVSGGYHQIGAFLDRLERSESMLRVREMGIVGDQEDLYHHKGFILFQAYLLPPTPKAKESVTP